jgi:hypothetical protein
MDSELRDYLDAKFAALDANFASVDAKFEVIDAKFAGVDAKFLTLEDRIMQRMDGRIDASEERMKEFVRQANFDLETKIVAEFWKWARGSDIRTREAISISGEASARVQLISERLLIAEDRISALERRGAA